MTNTVKISCAVDTTDAATHLGFEVWIGDHKFFDEDHVQTRHPILIEIPNDDGEHELKFVLKNKMPEHTRVDEAGNIVADAKLIISELSFDGIQLGNLVAEQSVYLHDFNGTGKLTQNKFYSEMGCNGTVSLKFTTPIYLWLLEHM